MANGLNVARVSRCARIKNHYSPIPTRFPRAENVAVTSRCIWTCSRNVILKTTFRERSTYSRIGTVAENMAISRIVLSRAHYAGVHDFCVLGLFPFPSDAVQYGLPRPTPIPESRYAFSQRDLSGMGFIPDGTHRAFPSRMPRFLCAVGYDTFRRIRNSDAEFLSFSEE